MRARNPPPAAARPGEAGTASNPAKLLASPGGTVSALAAERRRERAGAGGAGVAEALVEAGATRLRPILMTSAAMVLGMLPAALSRGDGSEFRAPMAVAVIGGVVASTFLTLVVVPVVYTWMDGLTLRGRAERRAARAAAAARAAGGEAGSARAEAA